VTIKGVCRWTIMRVTNVIVFFSSSSLFFSSWRAHRFFFKQLICQGYISAWFCSVSTFLFKLSHDKIQLKPHTHSPDHRIYNISHTLVRVRNPDGPAQSVSDCAKMWMQNFFSKKDKHILAKGWDNKSLIKWAKHLNNKILVLQNLCCVNNLDRNP